MGLSPSLLQGTERLREGLVGVRMLIGVLEGLNINPPKGKYYAIVRNRSTRCLRTRRSPRPMIAGAL